MKIEAVIVIIATVEIDSENIPPPPSPLTPSRLKKLHSAASLFPSSGLWKPVKYPQATYSWVHHDRKQLMLPKSFHGKVSFIKLFEL